MNTQTANNLADVLKTFNESTIKLQRAYEALQVRFGELDRELEESNKQLNRKVAEINEIKEYLNSILQSVTDGVIAVNLGGEITAFNKAAGRITGLEGKDVIGLKFEDIFQSDFGFNFEEAAVDESNRGSPYMTCDMQVRGREAFPVRESTSLTRDGQGKVTGAVKVFEDLTELRELEEQARRQDRLVALGQMAATVAHEIRNPLGGIEGFASLLSRDFEEGDPRLRLVTKILEGARSLNRVVSELLVFTRPIKLDYQKIELVPLIETALSFVGENIRRSGIRLYKKFGSKQLMVWGDGEELERAVLNIILNAVQAMPQGGTLSVSCRRRSLTRAAQQMLDIRRNGTWVDIAVRDSGPGIEQEDIPRIFNPFYTKKEKGTGLGLAIAMKIVEAHQGQITASNSPKGGALFVISLPLEY
jgi:PAS domain S-box-containing protein